MEQDTLIINYEGTFTVEIVDDLLYQLKEMLGDSNLDIVVRKRMYSLSVECLDNILKHSDIHEGEINIIEKYPAKFAIDKSEKGYNIYTGNVILNENKEKVEGKLTHLNSLQTGEVNQLYKESLSNAEISEKGGAGLGLIVMVKTTGEKIKFKFDKINDKFSYFVMQLSLKN